MRTLFPKFTELGKYENTADTHTHLISWTITKGTEKASFQKRMQWCQEQNFYGLFRG